MFHKNPIFRVRKCRTMIHIMKFVALYIKIKHVRKGLKKVLFHSLLHSKTSIPYKKSFVAFFFTTPLKWTKWACLYKNPQNMDLIWTQFVLIQISAISRCPKFHCFAEEALQYLKLNLLWILPFAIPLMWNRALYFAANLINWDVTEQSIFHTNPILITPHIQNDLILLQEVVVRKWPRRHVKCDLQNWRRHVKCDLQNWIR